MDSQPSLQKREETPRLPLKANSGGWYSQEKTDSKVVYLHHQLSAINVPRQDINRRTLNHQELEDWEIANWNTEQLRQIDCRDVSQAEKLQKEDSVELCNDLGGKSADLYNTSPSNLRGAMSPKKTTPFESLLTEILPPVSQSISKKDLALLITDLAKDQDLSVKERHRYVKALIRLLLKRGSLKPRKSRDTSPSTQSMPQA